MMKTSGSCLFTVNSADQSITPYSQGGGGQLVNVTTGKIATSATNITSINGNGSYVILTDTGNNTILPYSRSARAARSSITVGGAIAERSRHLEPGLLVYRTTQQQVPVHPQPVDHEHHADAAVQLHHRLPHPAQQQPRHHSPALRTSVDSGPVCMVEDPTNKYLYISDHNSGQVTGKLFDPNTGALSQLTRGSTFSATGLASCLAISGAVD